MIKQKVLTLLVLLAAVVTGARAAWTGGTYTATANENLNAITVSDDATLTINQGVTVTVSGGIVVADGKTLTITGGGTLVANGANGQTGNAGGTAIAGNVIINGVGLTVTATGGQGGQGAQGGEGDQGADGSNGYDGGQGGKGGQGANGGSAFSGAVTIYAGSVRATGGQGGKGGKGGKGGDGGAGDEGGDGGNGGNGGDGGDGGRGGYAFAGTLTVYGGNVDATGGQKGNGGNVGDGGDGGDGGIDGNHGDPGDPGEWSGDNGSDGNAYANNVTFEAATYTMTNGTDNITEATGRKTVIITSPDVVPDYAVTLADGTEDATNWTITPAEATTTGVAAGTEVKATYSGTKHVKSVKAVKKAEPAGLTLDLATVTTDITIEDGYTVTGTLGANVKISIADGATVTLDGVTINRVNNSNYKWAGINCLGDATIILSSNNTVKGFYDEYPGIHVPQDKTLTIDGSGSLTASSRGFACGIGGGDNIACGNIVIAGGTITATGGNNSAGIGGGNSGSCGNISITGGTITANGGGGGAGIGIGDGGSCGNISITGGTINATGGNQAAGIGGGYGGSCGNITITNGVTSVTATKGNSASHSIGVGSGNGTCGTVTIGGATGAKSESPYTYPEAK